MHLSVSLLCRASGEIRLIVCNISHFNVLSNFHPGSNFVLYIPSQTRSLRKLRLKNIHFNLFYFNFNILTLLQNFYLKLTNIGIPPYLLIISVYTFSIRNEHEPPFL